MTIGVYSSQPHRCRHPDPHHAEVLPAPTHFSRNRLKALIDRAGFVALANGGAFSGKIGAAVVASRRGGATHVFDTINHMFLISSMTVPGSLYCNLGMGCSKGEVLGDEEAIRNMNHLGETIAWLGAAISSLLPVRHCAML